MDPVGTIGILHFDYKFMASLCSIAIFGGMTRFFDFSPRLSIFLFVIKKASTKIFYLLVMTAVYFIAYAVATSVIYGDELEKFDQLLTSILTMFRMLFNDYDLLELSRKSQSVTFFFGFSFFVIFWFLIRNIFIVLIITEYEAFQKFFKKNEKNTEALKNCASFF